MKLRIHVPRPVGVVILAAFTTAVAYWAWTSVGATGELRPSSPIRVLFPIWGNTALHTTGYAWAREGDTILIDYDVQLEAGFFSLTVGKMRWFSRRLLRHEQSRSLRTSAAGQLAYEVRENGWHTIWAGKYAVWSGDARVRWSVRTGSPR